jgi:hypothetical protein
MFLPGRPKLIAEARQVEGCETRRGKVQEEWAAGNASSTQMERMLAADLSSGSVSLLTKLQARESAAKVTVKGNGRRERFRPPP